MCLSRVKRNYYKNPLKIKRVEAVGYKVFRKGEYGELVGQYFGYGKRRPVGKWLHEKDFRSGSCLKKRWIDIWTKGHYPFGFHYFSDLYNARNWKREHFRGDCVIREIKVRNFVCRGVQDGYSVYVAKEVLIVRGGLVNE